MVALDLKANPTKFWQFINSKKHDTVGVSQVGAANGITYTDNKAKTNILKATFKSIFNIEADQHVPGLSPSIIPSISKIQIREEGVLKLLVNHDPHKSAGPDEIPSFMPKSYANQLAPILTIIYQASIDQSTIPNNWTKANVTPIFKKGDKANPGNYRPISLTCICCKILEHIISSQVMDNFNKHKIFSDAQHGFRTKRFCESQLITTIHKIAQVLDQGEQTDVILLDFQKTF